MRHNIFNAIHKALKAISYDTALTIQQANFLDKEETEESIAKLEQTLSLLDLHIMHEGEFIHPLIEQFDIDIDRHFREKHIESKLLADKVKVAFKELEHSNTQEDKIKKGKAVSEAFETLAAFNLALFIKEEHVLNEMLWSNYRDEEIMAVEQQIIATVPADILEFETAWMVRSLNNFEICQWLLGVKQFAPEFVFQSLVSLTENELPGKRFEKLLSTLSQAATHEYTENTVQHIF